MIQCIPQLSLPTQTKIIAIVLIFFNIFVVATYVPHTASYFQAIQNEKAPKPLKVEAVKNIIKLFVNVGDGCLNVLLLFAVYKEKAIPVFFWVWFNFIMLGLYILQFVIAVLIGFVMGVDWLENRTPDQSQSESHSGEVHVPSPSSTFAGNSEEIPLVNAKSESSPTSDSSPLLSHV